MQENKKKFINFIKNLCIDIQDNNEVFNILKQETINFVENNKELIDRLEIEFNEIEKAGLIDYFIQIIKENRKFYNTRNLLCCYLWDICPENPIEENKDLIWSVSNEMPDIDVDFQPEARNHIKRYCSETFGNENVVSIANYNHFGIKSGIRDVSRVLEVPLPEVNACTTKMGDDVNRMKSWEEAVDAYPVLAEFEKKYPEVCKIVKKFNGRVRSIGMHAGGIVIASCNLTETIPLITRTDPKTKEKMILSSFAEGQARSDLKSVGLVKQDFLGLENLNYISTCLKIMQERGKYDPKVGIFRLSEDQEDWTDESYLNDEKCISVANEADLQLIFQFDSDGMRKLIKKGGVTGFGDLVAYTSIFRPGPFEHFADKFCNRKQGKEEYTLHKVLEPILGDTYGCVCIAKGSKVVIKNGYKNIENIKINDLVLTEDGTYQKVLKVINNGIKQTLKIRCSNGEELFCTSDHKILTSEGWKKAEDLSKNDLIKSFWVSKQNKINIQSDIDWLVGLILADGYMSRGGSVTICCSDEIFANKTANIVKKIFPDLDPKVQLVTRTSTSSCWQCRLVHKRSGYSSKNSLIQYLKEIKIWGLTKNNKKFPKKISLSMIAGLLEGDANIKTRTIKLRNKNLSYELFKALQSYRINSSYFEEIEPQFNKKLYCVTFHDYKHIIPFKIKKDSFWKEHRSVVVPRQFLIERKNNYKNLSCEERKKIHGITCTRSSKTKFISKYIADKYIDNYEHDHWSRVLSIKNDIKREVYDLSIDKNHSYVVGGLVVHNCYQEQLMNIMNKVGLISLQNVDNIRRAMAKKKEKEFIKFKSEFVRGGCKTLGWNKEEVEDLWNQMINFASYGFNKSHALSYSVISARCLYLKTYYPIEYFTAVLSHLKTGDDRVSIYIQEGLRKGLKFKKVDINKSKLGFNILNDEIFIGFDKIKGINKEAKNIIDLQPFESFEDYLSRYGYDKKVGEVLISCGAFDKFNSNIKLLLSYFEYRRKISKEIKGMNKIEFGKMYKELTGSKSCPKDISSKFSELLDENEKKIEYNKLLKLVLNNKFNFIDVKREQIIDYLELNKDILKHNIISLENYEIKEKIEDFTHFEKCNLQKEYYSFYFNHPISNARREGYKIRDVLDSESAGTIEGMISDIQKRKTSKGNSFYVLTVEDEMDSVKIVLWENEILKNKKNIFKNSFVKLDICPSKYSTWNLSKFGFIEKINSLDEPSKEEEIYIESENKFNEILKETMENKINA